MIANQLRKRRMMVMIKWFKKRFYRGRDKGGRTGVAMPEVSTAAENSLLTHSFSSPWHNSNKFDSAHLAYGKGSLSDSGNSDSYLRIVGDVSSSKNYNTTLNIVFFRLEEVMKKEKPYLERSFSLERLASKAGTNRTYASNAINNIAGCSFSKYVNRYRLDYATEMLNDAGSEIQIENLSALSGYKDIRSFLIALYDTKEGAYKSLKNKYLCDNKVKKQKYYL